MIFRPTTLSLLLISAGLTFAHAPAFAATGTKAVTQGPSAQQIRLAALAEDYYQKSLELNPISATEQGEHRYDDRLPMTLTPEIRAQELAYYKKLHTDLSRIQRRHLNVQEKQTLDIMLFETEAALKLSAFPDHLMPVNQMDSIPLTLAHFAGGQSAQPLKTPEQYRTFLKRLQQLPAWLQAARANMEQGIQRKVVLPKALVISMLPQYEQMVTAQPEDHPYFAPVKQFPEQFSAQDKQQLANEYREALKQQIIPALSQFLQFLKNDYLPAARTSTGWANLPDGKRWYNTWAQVQTTTSLTPEAIHQTGLKEVARIQSEYAKLGPQLGYKGEAKAFPAWMEAQTTYRPFKTEKEVLDAYLQIDAYVRKKLPDYFGKIPKAPLEIRPEPEISRATASDHYSSPALDGSRPGVFWAVINNPADYATTGMKTLYLHEGQPGHHFHLAFLQELDLPKFRRVGGNTAYTEGWALYSETLGKEMGLFDNDPASYYGHLSDEMLRATRLVVDTGMHAKGWTREQGIQYLQETLGYTEAASRQAIERYMAWPGQALGYKVGSLKIMELRKRAENELGATFSLKAFHDEVLSDGTLPLALLEKKMLLWIATQKAAR
jgi:uncharacterized protein (DUF885 family)